LVFLANCQIYISEEYKCANLARCSYCTFEICRKLRFYNSLLLVRIVCLIDEANRPESLLLTLVYGLNITPTVWASTWVPWAHFREPLVVSQHRSAHLLSMELIRVEEAL